MANVAQSASPSKLSHRGREIRTGPLIWPAVGPLVLWAFVPLAITLWFSLLHYNLLDPITRFVGFDNYSFLLTDPSLLDALWNTVALVAGVLVASIVLGCLFAVLFDQDFFGQKTGLTVSGQLEGELFALAFSDIYTFGPTFRAENSNTPRHAAEFWMIEPEMAFADLADDAQLAEEFVRYLCRFTLEECADDMAFFDKQVEKGLLERIRQVAEADFARMDYGDAIERLQRSGATFTYPVEWGLDLQTEHERYLSEQVVGGPVFILNYPKEIKAFYMRQNSDGRTVAAMDLLVPKVGELIGGSQREERLDRLTTRMTEMNIPREPLWWYLDSRRWGSCPHAGFGLGFERLVMYLTGMDNIRDVIPFPRTPRHAEF